MEVSVFDMLPQRNSHPLYPQHPSNRRSLPFKLNSIYNINLFATLPVSPGPSKEMRAGKGVGRLHSRLQVNTPLLLGSSRIESHGSHQALGLPHDLISRLRKSPDQFPPL